MKNILRKALLFATEKHSGQFYNEAPYLIHPILTAQIVSFLVPEDKNLIAAAYLHDVIEDCGVKVDELTIEFNEDVSSLVWEVTKDDNGNFSHISTTRGLLLKISDRLANVSSLENASFEKKEKLFKKYSYCLMQEGAQLKNE